jgi:DHA2 family lincomycin resistance protein-like MFS transporter
MKTQMSNARKKIQMAVIKLLKDNNGKPLKVSQICKTADINRSTFYAIYEDCDDMINHLQNYVVKQYNNLIDNKEKLPFLEMLKNIAAHQDTYELFFYFHLDRKVNESCDFSHYFTYQDDATIYDKIFVQAAVNAVIRYWLNNHATGIALPLMFNIILEQVPKSKIGTMMGVGNLITGAAPALGPTFGGIVINNLGWRWVFYLLIPFIIISLLLGLWGIQQKSELVKQKIDVPSFLLIAIFFSGAIYGFSNLSSGNILEIVLPLIFVVIAAILLVRRTKSLEHPLLKLDLLKNKYFAATVLGFFLIQMISLGNAFLLPNYIQLTNNSTAMTAGLLVLPAGAVGAIMGPIGGNLLDKHGARNVTLAGVYLMISELAIFAIFSRNMSNIFIMLVYILYMGGMGMILGNVMTYALSRIDKKWVTQGNAILSTVQQFAGAVGTSVTSAIVAVSQNAFHSKAGMPTAIGTQHAFIFLLIVAIIIWALFFKYVKDKH